MDDDKELADLRAQRMAQLQQQMGGVSHGHWHSCFRISVYTSYPDFFSTFLASTKAVDDL